MVGDEGMDFAIQTVGHGREMKEDRAKGRYKKQLQEAGATESELHDETKTEQGDAVENEMANIAMTKNMGYQLPDSKLVAIGVEQVELEGVEADVGQGHLGQSHQGHDDEQIFKCWRQLGHGYDLNFGIETDRTVGWLKFLCRWFCR